MSATRRQTFNYRPPFRVNDSRTMVLDGNGCVAAQFSLGAGEVLAIRGAVAPMADAIADALNAYCYAVADEMAAKKEGGEQ